MECPHCKIGIEIIEVNCAIFRCGIYKDSFQQIPPHLPKKECDELGNTIYGCGKPFKLVDGKLEICDYL